MSPSKPTGINELPESRLYTFIDESREFAIHFLEGQKLIQDLALLHSIRRAGFAYFREVVLSVQPMVALLKYGEQFGFYIDSDAPHFRLKIETGHHGATRCMLLPEEFAEFPETMRGIVRVLKVFPNNTLPYESLLQIESLALREIVNRVLEESYQVNSEIVVSQSSDQSLMLLQLPPLPRKEEYEYSFQAVRKRRKELAQEVGRIFDRALHRPEEIEAAFTELGYRLLAARTMEFRCSCSRERLVQQTRLVYEQEGEALFDPGQLELEVICEYCKTPYRIGRDELEEVSELPN